MKNKNVRPRPPIVTLMGHVDHGKTSLLDAIRKSNIAAGEHGQITQHIGAYTVEIKGKKITFLDTPGHEAFTAMRARGAQVTDIVILVVAVNEGAMPQTIEAIDHCRTAQVPIIVALSKVDKGSENAHRVKAQLAQHELLSEDLGGQTLFVETAALKGIGVDKLLEAIILQAEILELKADYSVPAEGVVIETKMERGTGPNTTLIILNGILKVRQTFWTGNTNGKVRAIFNDQGKAIPEVTPGLAARVVGAVGLPSVGAKFQVVSSEKEARELSKNREIQALTAPASQITLEEFYQRLQESTIKELNVILKADVSGSVEAIIESLGKMAGTEVKIKMIHFGVGPVLESDILLAKASTGIVLGFNVGIEPAAKVAAQHEKVQVKSYRVIYDLLDDMRKALSGLLTPEIKETILGKALVKEVFNLSNGQIVAGCSVAEGKITRGNKSRLYRGENLILESNVTSLRRFKENVREVLAGYECGISLGGAKEIQPGDTIAIFQLEEVNRSL